MLYDTLILFRKSGLDQGSLLDRDAGKIRRDQSAENSTITSTVRFARNIEW